MRYANDLFIQENAPLLVFKNLQEFVQDYNVMQQLH